MVYGILSFVHIQVCSRIIRNIPLNQKVKKTYESEGEDHSIHLVSEGMDYKVFRELLFLFGQWGGHVKCCSNVDEPPKHATFSIPLSQFHRCQSIHLRCRRYPFTGLLCILEATLRGSPLLQCLCSQVRGGGRGGGY